MKGATTLEAAKIREAADLLLEKSKGFTVQNSEIETLDSNLSFPTLRNEALAYEIAPLSQRPVAIAKVAIYRDARYSVVNGVYCHTMAIRSAYRGLYDKRRILYALEQS